MVNYKWKANLAIIWCLLDEMFAKKKKKDYEIYFISNYDVTRVSKPKIKINSKLNGEIKEECGSDFKYVDMKKYGYCLK